MQNRSSRLMTVGAGNAIASDLESLIANQVSAVGSFAVPDHPESCSFSATGLIYSCTKSGDGKSVAKSYQFLDASGSPMDKFLKGTTEAIHYLMKTDAIESRDNNKSVTHSLRDATLSGFLGPDRIWNVLAGKEPWKKKRVQPE